MKKIYTLIAVTTISFTANAQQKSPSLSTLVKSVHSVAINPNINAMAVGDTLMYMPLPSTFVNPTDNAAFNMQIEDIDALPPNNSGAEMAFGVLYSLDSSLNSAGNPTSDNYFHPWETPGVDSTFFWHATSWFNPAGTANNWLMFGPITLTAGGIVSWYDRTNSGYRDGYKLYATTTPSSPVTFSDFTGNAIYTKTSASPSNTAATDTTWVLRTAVIPPMYETQSIYLAFQHNANDMDVLYLDEITVVESPLGINENSFVNSVKVLQNNPNPFNNISTINYELEKNAAISLVVFDLTGNKIIEQKEGNQSAGKHNLKINAANLSAGVYYYSLTVGSASTGAMKMVVIK